MVNLKDIIEEGRILENEMLCKHTTLKIGGPCKALVTVNNIDELVRLVAAIQEEKESFVLLGNGSNVLADDEGCDKIVVKLGGDFESVNYTGGCMIEAGAGATLAKLSKIAMENALTGAEFASGIPGTVGGALVMNAGAYGGEMKGIVDNVTLMSCEKVSFTSPVMKYCISEDGSMTGEFDTIINPGDIFTLDGNRMEFGYRSSILKKRSFIALYASCAFEMGDEAAIKEKMKELNAARREKQPLEYPSAGSTFKRPEGYFAAKLIEDAGLKGYAVGDAMVSEKHAGFCINKGNATAKDFKKLMQDVYDKVKENSGVELEAEVLTLNKCQLPKTDKAVELVSRMFT